MGYDPNEPRDRQGRWSRGGYGPGQKLKGKYNEPSGRKITDPVAKVTQSGTPRGIPDVPNRWSQMSTQERARLEASARFETTFKQGSRKSRGIATSAKPKNLHEATVMTKDGPRMIYEPSRHAVAIQTAKALDKDFRAARDKANKAAMSDALSKTTVPVIKYPSQKPKKGR